MWKCFNIVMILIFKNNHHQRRGNPPFFHSKKTNIMHNFKSYQNPTTKEIFSACTKCGGIEVKNPDHTEEVCSGKMHKNSNVKALCLVLIEESK